MQIFMGLLDDKQKEGEDHAVVYMTRDMLDAGKRVINICDTDVDRQSTRNLQCLWIDQAFFTQGAQWYHYSELQTRFWNS
jgi:hypothetical protein